MQKLTTRQQAIINAMKYVAKHNKQFRFKLESPNQYRNTWLYSLIDSNKMFFGTVQSLEVVNV